MMSVAKELGVSEVVEDSSGNAGASVAAYAARGRHTGAHLRARERAPPPSSARLPSMAQPRTS